MENQKKTLFGLQIRQDSIRPKMFCKFYVKEKISVLFSVLFSIIFVIFGPDFMALSFKKEVMFWAFFLG